MLFYPCTHIHVQVCPLNSHTDLNILLCPRCQWRYQYPPVPATCSTAISFFQQPLGGNAICFLTMAQSCCILLLVLFYDILILSYLLLASVFWIAPDFLIFTCLVAQLVAFHSSHVFLFSVFLCLLPSFVCISSTSLLSLSFSLCLSQSFPHSNIKSPPLPSTQTLLLSTDSTGLAHCHLPTSVWPLPLLPPPPPLLPLRRKRQGWLGTRPSSPPSSPPRSPQPFPQSREE